MTEPNVTGAASGLSDNAAGAIAYITFIPAIIFLIVDAVQQECVRALPRVAVDSADRCRGRHRHRSGNRDLGILLFMIPFFLHLLYGG